MNAQLISIYNNIGTKSITQEEFEHLCTKVAKSYNDFRTSITNSIMYGVKFGFKNILKGYVIGDSLDIGTIKNIEESNIIKALTGKGLASNDNLRVITDSLTVNKVGDTQVISDWVLLQPKEFPVSHKTFMDALSIYLVYVNNTYGKDFALDVAKYSVVKIADSSVTINDIKEYIDLLPFILGGVDVILSGYTTTVFNTPQYGSAIPVTAGSTTIVE